MLVMWRWFECLLSITGKIFVGFSRHPPLHHWVKLNTDGSSRRKSSGAGGVIRDSQGKWLLFFFWLIWANLILFWQNYGDYFMD